ncbi:MAG: co-chaperone GroES [Planctomycetes bacterium]|nr:co-chaperone GroES [Planctomycetota bacterium]
MNEYSETKPLDKLIVIGDRVLIRPRSTDQLSKGGLYLPAGVQQKAEIQSGYVVKVGPGYPVPGSHEITDEAWKKTDEGKVRYVPLQVMVGDLAIFLKHSSHEVEYNGDKYIIVPQQAILMLERDENLFNSYDDHNI